MISRFLNRFLSTVVGASILFFGVGMAWIPFIPARRERAFLHELLFFSLGGFVCLLGASMVWQYARGANLERGFFICGLRALPRVVTPAQVFAALGGAALVSLVLGVVTARPYDTRAGGALLLSLLVLHAHVGWHEFGHLWATYACRYRPKRVVVCGLAAKPVGRRWTLHPNREWRFFLGGAVVFSAEENRRTWSRDLLCYSAGPLATLLSICALMMAQPFSQGVPRLEQLRQQNLELAIFMLVFNLLPLRQFRTDGYELLELMKLRS